MNWKSIGAVVAGALFMIVVTVAADAACRAAGILPPMNQPIGEAAAVLATLYLVVIGVAGGWLTARLAPSRPMTHALVLGGIGFVLGTVAVVATWSLDLGPRWYAISHVILAIPECWAGAQLFKQRSSRRARI